MTVQASKRSSAASTVAKGYVTANGRQGWMVEVNIGVYNLLLLVVPVGYA